MDEHDRDANARERLSGDVGKWLGWIGIIVGIIGFFWLPTWMGITAIVLGIIGLFSAHKTLSIIAIVAGVIALCIAWIL